MADEHYESFGTTVKTVNDPSLGHNKSGRPWKLGLNSKPPKKVTTVNEGLKMSWDQRKKRKEEMQHLRDQLKEFRAKKIEKKKQEKERRKEKRKQKELNTLKSGNFEVIKDTKKMKKWNKRVRDQLVKLPAEMFERLINK